MPLSQATNNQRAPQHSADTPSLTSQPATGSDAVAVKLSGIWVLAHYRAGQRALEAFARQYQDSEQVIQLDARDISRLDTSAAHLLYQYFGAEALEQAQFNDEHRNLVQLVLNACEQKSPLAPKAKNSLVVLLAEVGEFCTNALHQQKLLLGFIGQVLIKIFQVSLNPRRWRMTPLAAQVEQVGLNAVPIVALLTFLVGAVVAFLGATVLGDFGADIYTVNLVGFSFLREFGVLLAAILLAGRTASAFTAQLGSMKANEEIDALRAQGLDPIELLVVPRVLAMLISLPVLTILAMVSGVAGGMLVCWLALDISPQLFMHIFARDIDISHFWSGLVKAPVFAFMIGLIGCLEGFKVAGSAQSVGEHTTSSVVQSIFMVILLDALFALFFMEIGW